MCGLGLVTVIYDPLHNPVTTGHNGSQAGHIKQNNSTLEVLVSLLDKAADDLTGPRLISVIRSRQL
jgi:hypothetical protein